MIDHRPRTIRLAARELERGGFIYRVALARDLRMIATKVATGRHLSPFDRSALVVAEQELERLEVPYVRCW